MQRSDSYFLYVTGILDNPIIRSQVLNWIELLQDEGIVFDILTCPSIPYLIKNGKKHKSVLNEYRGKLIGKIYQVITIRSLDRYDFISPLIKLIAVLVIIWKKRRKQKKSTIVIQTRTGTNFKTFKLLKKINKKVKIVFEFRGAAPEEYLNSMSFRHIDQVNRNSIRKKYQHLLSLDIQMAILGDVIYCVSNSLKNYLIGVCKENISGKVYVIPGAADENVFFYSPRLKVNKQKELGLKGKRMLIYTGRLKNKYHKKELIFNFASRYISESKKNVFVCLTPDLEAARILQARLGIPDNQLMIRYENDQKEINSYLNAADMGVIFRDNVPTNNVSSPTKLAEYLLTGLPVLASSNIGDYSEFIKQNGLGIIIENDIDMILKCLITFDFESVNRERNSIIARQKFSKKSGIRSIKKILNQIEI